MSRVVLRPGHEVTVDVRRTRGLVTVTCTCGWAWDVFDTGDIAQYTADLNAHMPQDAT